MKSLVIAATLLAGAAPAVAQDKELCFEAPPSVNDLERIKAAKALAIRCVASGSPAAHERVGRPVNWQ